MRFRQLPLRQLPLHRHHPPPIQTVTTMAGHRAVADEDAAEVVDVVGMTVTVAKTIKWLPNPMISIFNPQTTPATISLTTRITLTATTDSPRASLKRNSTHATSTHAMAASTTQHPHEADPIVRAAGAIVEVVEEEVVAEVANRVDVEEPPTIATAVRIEIPEADKAVAADETKTLIVTEIATIEIQSQQNHNLGTTMMSS